MSLLAVQIEFTKLVPRLIDQAFELGFDVTLGDAFRDPRVHGEVGVKMGYGHPKSNHKQRLAIDLNLFMNGVFYEGTDTHAGYFGDREARCGDRTQLLVDNYSAAFVAGFGDVLALSQDGTLRLQQDFERTTAGMLALSFGE